MAERIFVTGASGRIGIPLVQALAQQGHHVVGLARTEQARDRVQQAGARECLVGDVYDVATLAEGCRGAERIFHLAGGLRGKGRETPYCINRDGTANLVQALEQSSARPRVLLFTSSWAVYGDRSGLWVDETHPPHPHTGYGESKAQAEALLLEAAEKQDIPVVITRLASVYGPGFPFLYEQGIRKGWAVLPGEGRNHVPVIHVDDCVAALLRIAEQPQPGGTWPVVEPDQPTLAEFYQAVAEQVDGRPPRFWSTYVPSYIQLFLLKQLERGLSRLPVRQLFTPDVYKLFTASARMRPDRLEEELEFEWRYPDFRSGIAASVGSSAG